VVENPKLDHQYMPKLEQKGLNWTTAFLNWTSGPFEATCWSNLQIINLNNTIGLILYFIIENYNCCCRSKYGLWSEDDMQRALAALDDGMGLNAASRAFQIPKATLKRHKDDVNIVAKGSKKHLGTIITLPEVLEQQLADHILKLESMLFGLTRKDVMSLAFQLAERNNIRNRFNKENKSAGDKWLKLFLKRNSAISLRSPEPTSIARAAGFNKKSVHHFLQLLQQSYTEYPYGPGQIFNMDETGLTTVQKPQKILAKKGKHQVGALTSAERGVNTTVVCCVSAAGQYVPPMIIFKRLRMKEELKDGAPPGSLVVCNESGWMDSDMYYAWLQHFIQVVKPSKENPVLLVLDGHTSHTKNLDAIMLARENRISLPPHTTHRLQPLDVAFFKPLQQYYDQAATSWLKSHEGRGITAAQVSRLFGEAYGKAATVSNATSGFAKCGIYPLNLNQFDDSEFLACLAPNDSQEPLTQIDINSEKKRQNDRPNLTPDLNEQDHVNENRGNASVTTQIYINEKEQVSPNNQSESNIQSTQPTIHTEGEEQFMTLSSSSLK